MGKRKILVIWLDIDTVLLAAKWSFWWFLPVFWLCLCRVWFAQSSFPCPSFPDFHGTQIGIWMGNSPFVSHTHNCCCHTMSSWLLCYWTDLKILTGLGKGFLELFFKEKRKLPEVFTGECCCLTLPHLGDCKISLKYHEISFIKMIL